jgi:nitroreductase
MIKEIQNHRSIRKYKSTAISDELLNEIILAGTRASTTGNMQIYSIIITKKQELREKLWECHFKQDMVKQAPVTLTFCADINRFNKWCELNNTKPGYDNFLWFVNASIDALLVSQNVALEAEAHGLGICYLGTTTYMADKIIDILELPNGVIPITTIVLGYADETPGLTDRLPLEAIAHNEKYIDYTNAKIEELFSEKESSEFYKKIVEESETNNLAEVFTEKRYKKADNLFFSKKFIEILEKQGFMNNE